MGLVCFVKAECPTCQMVKPVLRQLRQADVTLTVFTQDDTSLGISYRQRIEIVPTLMRVANGEPVERLEGWDRREWERMAGVNGLGEGLPGFRPGCGSRTLDPGMPETLALRYGGSRMPSWRIQVGALKDEVETTLARG